MKRIRTGVLAVAIATTVLLPSVGSASASVGYAGWYYGFCLGSMAYYGSWCNGMS